MDREVGKSGPVKAGVTPVSANIAAEAAATEKRRPATAATGRTAGKEEPRPATVATRETDEKEEPRPTTAAIAPIPAADAPASLDLNALHKMSPEDLAELAKKFGVCLQPARTRHYHILDLMRAALGAGSTVTAEGFIDHPGESIAFLRSPDLTFTPVPAVAAVLRSMWLKF